MENYFNILMAKKDLLKKLQKRFSELEDESAEVDKEVLQVQVQHARVYHELKALKQEPEINRVETGALLIDILFFIIGGLLTFYLKSLGLGLIKLIIVGLLVFGVGVFGTHGFVKWKKNSLLKLVETKKESINEKEEELKNLEFQKQSLIERLILVNRERRSVGQEIDVLLPDIAKLEELVDCYLAPYLSMYVDQSIEEQDKQVEMSLARIEKHLEK